MLNAAVNMYRSHALAGAKTLAARKAAKAAGAAPAK